MSGIDSSTRPPSRKVGRMNVSARDMAQIAVFAALIAALGLPGSITVGFSGVPITLQTLGIILAGAVLGPRKGTAAVLVFLALTMIGLPLLAGGTVTALVLLRGSKDAASSKAGGATRGPQA